MQCEQNADRRAVSAAVATPCPGEPLDTWFVREVLTLEGLLVQYLMSKWFSRDEVHDLRQEVYLRVYEAASRIRPRSAKAFVLTIARHLITDRLRRKRVVSIESGWDLAALDVLIDEVSPERSTGAHQELVRLSRAFDRLPPRCREVIWLRRIESLSQKEIAAQLGISEAMVEKHVNKAMRRLADLHLGSHRNEPPQDEASSLVKEESRCPTAFELKRPRRPGWRERIERTGARKTMPL